MILTACNRTCCLWLRLTLNQSEGRCPKMRTTKDNGIWEEIGHCGRPSWQAVVAGNFQLKQYTLLTWSSDSDATLSLSMHLSRSFSFSMVGVSEGAIEVQKKGEVKGWRFSCRVLQIMCTRLNRSLTWAPTLNAEVSCMCRSSLTVDRVYHG